LCLFSNLCGIKPAGERPGSLRGRGREWWSEF